MHTTTLLKGSFVYVMLWLLGSAQVMLRHCERYSTESSIRLGKAQGRVGPDGTGHLQNRPMSDICMPPPLRHRIILCNHCPALSCGSLSFQCILATGSTATATAAFTSAIQIPHANYNVHEKIFKYHWQQVAQQQLRPPSHQLYRSHAKMCMRKHHNSPACRV